MPTIHFIARFIAGQIDSEVYSYALTPWPTQKPNPIDADEVSLNLFTVGVIMIISTRMIILSLPSVFDDRRGKCIGSPLFFRGVSQSTGISGHVVDEAALNFIRKVIKNIRTMIMQQGCGFAGCRPNVLELPYTSRRGASLGHNWQTCR